MTSELSPCVFNGITSMTINTAGEVVATNFGEREICVFGPRGNLVRKFGRRGAGPGEFAGITAMHGYRGDSILVVDALQKRITILSSEGRVGREIMISAPDSGLGSLSFTAAMPTGELLLGFATIRQMAPSPTSVMIRQRIFHLSVTGEPLASLGEFVASEHFVQKT